MPLTHEHRRQIIAAYCIVFYALLLYKLWNGSLLFQLQPYLFNTRPDVLTWLFMHTGTHQWLLHHPTGWLVLDAAFYSMPLLYWLAFKKNLRLAVVVAVIMLCINWVYVQFYTLLPANSIESFIAWLLFPLLFMTVSLRSFYFVLQGLRYFFLFFFVSAAAWKLVQGGLLNFNEMSGVLLYQHKEYLASSPGDWYTSFIYWLVNHPSTGYVLYIGAAITELSFLIGFFTKKADWLLFAAAILFFLADRFIMRIPYWEVTPFLLTLLYSRYDLPLEPALQD